MQNEELRRVQAELGASQSRYFDLYDLAPVGHLTPSEKGLILETNLMAAILLGATKGALIKSFFTHLILPEDRDVYYLNGKQLLETGAPQEFGLRMLRANAAPFRVRIGTTATQDVNHRHLCGPAGHFNRERIARQQENPGRDRSRPDS